MNLKSSSSSLLKQSSSVVSGNKTRTLNTAFPVGEKGLLFGLWLVVVFSLLPVYIYRSGGFQIVDVPLVIIILLALFKYNTLIRENRKHIKEIIPFLLYAILVNASYFIYYSNDKTFLIIIIILSYGVTLLYSFVIIFNNLIKSKYFLIYIYLALIASIIGCFVAKGYDPVGRAKLSFNNPNQLAYFAIILASYPLLLLDFKRKMGINNKLANLLDIIIIIVAHFLALIAFSRSGAFALFILDIYLIKNMTKLKTIFPVFIALLLSIFLLNLLAPQFIEKRLTVRDEEQWTPRGLMYSPGGFFDRTLGPIFEMTTFEMIFGRGIGAERDWKAYTQIINKGSIPIEVHNMYGNVFRAYGLIGLALFGFWYFRLYWESRVIDSGFWIMTSLLVYNQGADGIRFRSFWIFLAFLIVMITIFKEQSQD